LIANVDGAVIDQLITEGGLEHLLIDTGYALRRPSRSRAGTQTAMGAQRRIGASAYSSVGTSYLAGSGKSASINSSRDSRRSRADKPGVFRMS
jgi:hypothetical protein